MANSFQQLTKICTFEKYVMVASIFLINNPNISRTFAALLVYIYVCLSMFLGCGTGSSLRPQPLELRS